MTKLIHQHSGIEELQELFSQTQLKRKRSRSCASIEISARQLHTILERLSSAERRIHQLESQLNSGDLGYISIAGFALLTHRSIDLGTAISLGVRAKAACARANIMRGKVWDARYGFLSTYPREILTSVFNEFFYGVNEDTATNG